MLKTKVKASQVTNLTDGRYFAAWEVEWIGFNFELGTDTSVDIQKMKEIRDWLEGPSFVGEFGLTNAETIRETATFLELDYVQINHFTEVETAKAIKDIPIIKEILILKEEDNSTVQSTMTAFNPYVKFFLLDFTKSGISWEEIKSGKYIDFYTLKQICQDYAVILSVDLNTDNLTEVMETLNPYGLNLTGGEEEKVGFKSFDDIDEIIEALYIEP
jgi:phosphoribosylanthranilate isomerase